MIRHLKPVCMLMFTLIALTASSCNSGRPFAEVTGALKVDGQPAPDCIVQFVPEGDNNKNAFPSSGQTDEDGRFRLMTNDEYPKDGAVIGWHRVVVLDARSVIAAEDRFDMAKRKLVPRSRIPDRYTTALSTPLRQEVNPGPQDVTIEVTSNRAATKLRPTSH
jgi:hypothetical protein